MDTEQPEHATEICREAAGECYDVVVAFGGDGTVNGAANRRRLIPGREGGSTACVPAART